MTNRTVEERLAALETLVVQLMARMSAAEEKKDWRSTLGMFANDEVSKQIDEECRRIREEDRRRTFKELDRLERKAKRNKRQRVKS